MIAKPYSKLLFLLFYLLSGSAITVISTSCIPFGGDSGSSPVPTPAPQPTPPTPAVNGWSTLPPPPTGGGRANNVGIASDQYGNLYVSYQTESNISAYRYMFSGTNTWESIAAPLAISNHSPYSTLAVSKINDIYLAYTGPNHEPSYLHALPDMSGWSASNTVQIQLAYQPAGAGCPYNPRTFTMSGNYVSMALTSSGQQMVAYQDETLIDADQEPNVVESTGICISPGYDGEGKLSVYLSSTANWFKISAGVSSQVKIAATPNDTSSYPVYAAYQDNAHSNSITVLKESAPLADSTWSAVGVPGFTNYRADFISLAVDSSGAPYVAYEDAGNNNKLTVQKFSNGSWQIIGGQNISTANASYISLAINPPTNTPYVAYQDSGQNNNIFVKQYNSTTNTWNIVGGPIQNLNNNYGTYTSLTILPNSQQPAIAFQNGAPGVNSSLTVMYSVVPLN